MKLSRLLLLSLLCLILVFLVPSRPSEAANPSLPGELNDIDGDGQFDLMVWRTTTGEWFARLSGRGYAAGAAAFHKKWGNGATDVPLLGDLDGDRRSDLIVWRTTTGEWFAGLSSRGYAGRSATFNKKWGNGATDVPLLGDLDGDRRSDLIVWRATTGEWFALLSSRGYAAGAAAFHKKWGNGTVDVPLLGDLDGDGRSDLIVWRTTTGEWFAGLSSRGYAGGNATFYKKWGSGVTDIPLLGDLDGDNKSDLIVWRMTTGEWFGRLSSRGYAAGNASFYKKWGDGIVDVPLLGDLDGDKRSDLIVWRTTTGEWFARLSGRGYAAGSASFSKNWGRGGVDWLPGKSQTRPDLAVTVNVSGGICPSYYMDFLRDKASLAQAERADSGVPASFSLAQAIRESRSPSSPRIWSSLALDYHNWHGLTCGVRGGREPGRSCQAFPNGYSYETYSSDRNGFLYHGRYLRDSGLGAYRDAFDHLDDPIEFARWVLPCFVKGICGGGNNQHQGLPEKYFQDIVWFIDGPCNTRQYDTGGGCTDDAQFVGQSQYPTVNPGQSFQIYFEVRNTGTCTWRQSDNYYLGNINGTTLGANPRQELGGDVPPGATKRWIINMTAPNSPGTYRTQWMVKHGDHQFGPNMYIDVAVRAPVTCPDQYRAEYYNNRTLSGSPAFVQCENWPIDHDWGNGGPGNGVGNDNFSVRWTGRAHIADGTYTFIARADDGIRVWIGNDLIIDEWHDQPPTEYRVTRHVSDGYYDIRVEYYENGGGAVAQFRWEASTCAGNSISLNQTVHGNIGSSGEQDSFCLGVGSAQWVSIRLVGCPNTSSCDLDPMLQVYKPDGSLLDSADDGFVNNSDSRYYYSSFLAVYLPSAGAYRVVARGFGSSTGNYGLRIEPGRGAAAGDFNKDCVVNDQDVSYMMSKFGTDDGTADLDLNGIVNSIDYSFLVSNNGRTCSSMLNLDSNSKKVKVTPVSP